MLIRLFPGESLKSASLDDETIGEKANEECSNKSKYPSVRNSSISLDLLAL